MIAMSFPDLTHAIWRKASLSESSEGCVEVAVLAGDRVAVRDSKDPHGPAHVYPASDWTAFLDGLRTGDPSASTRIRAEITAEDVILTGNAFSPLRYTHREWLFFLDGVLKHEPQLAALSV